MVLCLALEGRRFTGIRGTIPLLTPRRSAQGGRAATPLAPLTAPSRATSRAGSPVSPTGGSERAGAGRAVLPRYAGGGWMARYPPVERCWSLVRPRVRDAVTGSIHRILGVNIYVYGCPHATQTTSNGFPIVF